MNNPSTTQLTHFIHSIEQAVSLDELDVMLVHACQALSIHRFILCEFIQTPIHKTLYAMTATHLKEWETFYQIEKKYDIIDPIYDGAVIILWQLITFFSKLIFENTYAKKGA